MTFVHPARRSRRHQRLDLRVGRRETCAFGLRARAEIAVDHVEAAELGVRRAKPSTAAR